MQKIGYIGLGIMGKPMVLNLLRAGFSVTFYARKPALIEEIKQAGGLFVSSLSDLASQTHVIFTNVPATQDVEEILIGKHGIIHHAKPNTIVIDMSTISPERTRYIARTLLEKTIDMLDAPVSGGEPGAIAGTLTIMVGGKEAVLNKVLPILNILGKQITRIGENGAGQVAKACNQIIIAETIIAVSEALRLAKASGVDPLKVQSALLGGFANSKVLEIHGKRMIDQNYKPGFKAGLHRKDMHLALEQAQLVNLQLPAAQFAMECLDRLVDEGHSDLDSSALHLLKEE